MKIAGLTGMKTVLITPATASQELFAVQLKKQAEHLKLARKELCSGEQYSQEHH